MVFDLQDSFLSLYQAEIDRLREQVKSVQDAYNEMINSFRLTGAPPPNCEYIQASFVDDYVHAMTTDRPCFALLPTEKICFLCYQC